MKHDRTTLVLLQVGLDVENSAVLHRCTFARADEYLFGFLLLTSTLYFQLGSGSGLDIIKYPTCSNTLPLEAMWPDSPTNDEVMTTEFELSLHSI